MKPLGSTDLKRLHRDWRRRTEVRVALVLDSVQTPFNVGSILRTAAALRVEHVWICGATAAPTHDRTSKTSLGADRFLTFSTVESPADGPFYETLVATLRDHDPEGVPLPVMAPFATDAKAAALVGTPAYGFSPFVLAGDEVRGIHGSDESIPIERYRDGLVTMRKVVRASVGG